MLNMKKVAPSVGAITLPRPIRHYHSLSDGRLMAYYTFSAGASSTSSSDDESEASKNPKKHPVLYFHGFPGSGVEGALCAQSANLFHCKLYALDRPGFGSSEPLPYTDIVSISPDDYVSGVVQDVFDFVKGQGWTDFSIIAVSGGGPYAQAIMERYLRLQQEGRSNLPTLTAVSIVAGICCAAGTEGMMPQNQQLANCIIRGGYWTRVFLRWSFRFQRLLIRWVPTSWLLSLSSSRSATRRLPQADAYIMQNEPSIMGAMMDDVKESVRQSSDIMYVESQVLFRCDVQESLQQLWQQAHADKIVKVPRVTIFQGQMDVNVPPSHGKYVHANIFGGLGCSLREFPNLGHLSLVVGKADEYMQAAAAPKSTATA